MAMINILQSKKRGAQSGGGSTVDRGLGVFGTLVQSCAFPCFLGLLTTTERRPRRPRDGEAGHLAFQKGKRKRKPHQSAIEARGREKKPSSRRGNKKTAWYPSEDLVGRPGKTAGIPSMLLFLRVKSRNGGQVKFFTMLDRLGLLLAWVSLFLSGKMNLPFVVLLPSLTALKRPWSCGGATDEDRDKV